jgi:flagellar basal-body rod protein FlgG
MKALYAAASGMSAQQIRLDNIANNLANVSTVGFKKAREDFQDLFYQELTSGGQGVSTARVEVGTGVRLVALEKDHSAGQMMETGNPLDVAIDGNGYFVLESPEGERLYTRDGSFSRDADGMMISAGGMMASGDIMIPMEALQVQITSDGTVQVLMPDDAEFTTIGQLEMVGFVNPNGLRPIGNNLYQESRESGQPMPVDAGGDVKAVQGFLEGSNVDVAEELIALILTQRSYELNSKAIQAADEAMALAVNLKR